MNKKLLLLLLIIFTYSIHSQEIIRIASYNVQQYPNVNKSSGDLKTVLNQIKPTILITVELDGASAVQSFLNNVLTPKYKASTEVNITWGNGNECAVFYIDSLLTYLGSNMITADTRPIAEFKFLHKITKDTLIIFGVHLKAYPEETARRLNAVNSLRNRTAQLKPTANYLVAGDYNIFTSAEPAFQKLLDKSSSGYVIDMLNVAGDWNKNPLFAQYCTWSTRGGINTRFDMILISKTLNERGGIDYVPNSFKIFGNDGDHFYTNVNSGSNKWFPNDPSIGNALYNASDHLPVYADFLFGVPTSVAIDENIPTSFELMQNYPNPFNPNTVIRYKLEVNSFTTLKVYDLLGREVAMLVNEYKPAGIYNYPLLTENYQLSSGVYFYQLRVGSSITGLGHSFVQTRKMILLK